jgi:hypothetical protein
MADEEEPTIIYSPLQQRIERDGTYVDVQIYRGEKEMAWVLEVVDEDDASTLYEDFFESDQAALDEVLATIQEFGIRVYLENGFPDEDATPAAIH